MTNTEWKEMQYRLLEADTATFKKEFETYYRQVESSHSDRRYWTASMYDNHKRLWQRDHTIKMKGIDPMKHRTANNTFIEIACMDDDHLVNYIRMALDPLAQATAALEKAPAARSVRAQALYGNSHTKLVENYKEMVDTTYKRVGPYIMEAACRGPIVTNIVTNLVQKALGRTSQDLEGIGQPMALPSVDGEVIDTEGQS